MDCPDTCSLEVEVKDGRVTEIHGSNVNPVTAGFICSKVGNFTKRLYSPDRILYPMKRVGAKGSSEFERISWDEATAEICSRFQSIQKEYGGEALLPFYYGGSNGILGQETVDRAFFAKLGASRLALTVCAAPTTAAALGMYGKMPGVAFEDYLHAKFILVWGANTKASNIHLMPYIKKAKAAGAFVAVVDPRRNFSSGEQNLHLPVYPGTDLVVALSMIQYWNRHGMLNHEFLNEHTRNLDALLERAVAHSISRAAGIARVPARDIERLANEYAERSPAVLRMGWGPERNANGGQATAAILSMPALLGKFGVRGGGYTLSNSSATKVAVNKIVESIPWNTREINMNQLGKVLLTQDTPPIKGLFVYNANPAATIPNQNAVLKGLERKDLFTVVFDQILTDTARYADILLPATTFLEQDEIKKSYGSYVLHYVSQVIEPLGEAKPNPEVFAVLGKGMGWKDDAFSMNMAEYLGATASAIRGLGKDVTLEELRSNSLLQFDFPGTAPIQFETTSPWTSDGKIDLCPEVLGKHPYEPVTNGNGKYPLSLISPATSKTISSTMGEYNLPELFLSIHPEDASERSLKSGEMARIFNDLGEVVCRVKVTDSIRPGVVMIPKGAWMKSSPNQRTACALSPDTLGLAGGACFNDARVEVAQIQQKPPGTQPKSS